MNKCWTQLACSSPFDDHYSVCTLLVLRPPELLHHISSWGNGVLRTAAVRNHLEIH